MPEQNPEIDLTNLNLNAPIEALANLAAMQDMIMSEPQPTIYNPSPIFDVRGRGWDRISTPVPNQLHAALAMAGLDWTVAMRPVFVDDAVVPKRFATVRSDLSPGQNVLEIVGSKYHIVQNIDALSFVQTIIESNEIGFQLERAGSLNGGRTVFILAKTEGLTIAGEAIQPYVVFSNSHDGTSSVQAALTTIRVCCENTLALALKTAPRVWSIMHMKSAEDKIKAALESMNFIGEYLTAYPSMVESMTRRRIDEAHFADIANTLYPVPEPSASNDVAIRNASEDRAIFERVYYDTPDLQQHIGTAWGVYNAFADMESHTAPRRTTPRFEENRFIRNTIVGNRFVRAQNVIMASA